MLSRLAHKSRYTQFFKQLTKPSRTFATSSNIDGMGQAASFQDNENMNISDVDVGYVSKRSKGPALPHFDYTPPKYTGPSYEEVREMR